MQVSGQDYYCYAPEPGLFEPLVELGAEVEAGAAAGAIHPHDTPWREPAIARFGRAGTVICKRVPAASSAAIASTISSPSWCADRDSDAGR